MGRVYKKQYTMPAPRGAEIVEHEGRLIAHWKLRNGQVRSAEVVNCQKGQVRVRGKSRYFIANYRNGDGQVVETATNTRFSSHHRHWPLSTPLLKATTSVEPLM